MADETQEAKPTLDDVYREFNVTTQPVQEEKAAPRPSEPDAPDPATDPDRFSKYLSQQNQALKEKVSLLEQQTKQNSDYLRNSVSSQEDADFESTVGSMTKDLEGVPESSVKWELFNEARSDPRFAELWRNRRSNPKAMDKALSVIKQRLRDNFAEKTDSQLAENQRALDEATKIPSGRSKQDSVTEQMMKKSNADFDAEWRKILSTPG